VVRVGLYKYISIREIAGGRYDNALRVIDIARQDDNDSLGWAGLGELLHVMVARGISPVILQRVPSALQADTIRRVPPAFLATLGATLIVAGDRSGGEAKLATAEQDAEREANPWSRTIDFQALARAYAEAGEVARALDIVGRIFPPATSGSAHIDRWGILRDIAFVAMRAGHPDEAIQIAEQDSDTTLRDAVSHALALFAGDHAQYTAAERWARGIADDDERAQALADIAARGAVASSPDAKWVIVWRDEWERENPTSALLQ